MSENEANRIWDEYKYRHDHIWRHLVRSTVVVFALTTAGYSTSFTGNKPLFFVAALLAIVYLCFTVFFVVPPELRLYAKVKTLHRTRQNAVYKDCDPKDMHEDLQGKFENRVRVYLAALFIFTIATGISHLPFR